MKEKSEIVFIESKASFSSDRKYRYELTRIWNPAKPLVGFIGLNPSTGDEVENDPTIWKLSRVAESWGYGGFVIMNLFAFVTPGPEAMKKADEPIGKDTDKRLNEFGQRKDLDKIIAVWGDDGAFMDRGLKVKSMFKQLWVLKLSEAGQPRHPRFLKEDLKPIKWD